MRNTKFRVYNPRDKKMHYDITGFEFFCDGNMSGVFIDGLFFLIEEVEIMQYTGLKDRNGKEIYEGDIVKFKVYDDEIVISQVYTFEGTAFCIDIETVDCDVQTLAWAMNDRTITDVVVIGNIYDNPDLLEKGAEDE